MWGKRNNSGYGSSDYDDDYSSSSGSIYDYCDKVKYYVNNHFYYSDANLAYLQASVYGGKIVLKFKFYVYQNATSSEINSAMADVVYDAINSVGCPYDVSYSGEIIGRL